MSESSDLPPALDPFSCRERQKILTDYLRTHQLDAALITHRHYVHALTGYWHGTDLTAVGLIVEADGKATLCIPGDAIDLPAADACLSYPPQKLCTLVENVAGEMSAALRPMLERFDRVGTDRSAVPWQHSDLYWVDITTDYQYLRRKKFPDEISALLYAQRGSNAAYTEARRILEAGLSEVDLYAAMHAAAVREIGEALSGWGNDFQCGSPGGPPRRRAAQAGELAVLDIGVGARGYRTDQCRAFSVDGNPSDLQKAAHARCCQALERVEAQLKPGLSCRVLFADIEQFLHGWEGADFQHHLGHGIGLDPHEVPRLNPNWDDTLEVGDVIAVEPGLYRDDLKAGIRLEQNYLITEDGHQRLSNFPLDL
jgi:Xaa-Pro aminopeptidase